MANIALAMTVMVVFWAAMQWWQQRNTCWYCGGYRGHEPGCPLDL